MNKCIFLDRDGVINKDYVDYVYTIEKFQFLDRVPEALKKLKEAGYLLIVITNQSGIVKGTFKAEDVMLVHDYVQKHTDNALDDIYIAPYHEKWTNSLTRKPDSLMLERAIAKYNVDISQSWMVGDKQRDLIPGKKLGLQTCLIAEETCPEADVRVDGLIDLAKQLVEEKVEAV